MSTAGRARALRDAALAVTLYLALALWCLRAVLPHPASTIATIEDVPAAWRPITMADQKLVVAMVADHARALLHTPATLLDGPQCHPLRRALMLGQHELGEGFLGVVPYALTRDPVLTYNVVMLLSIALAGVAMHALVRSWTGDVVAAFVAGTLFAVHPARIGDVVHLSAIGNYWTAVSLLALTHFFARPTWPAAAALGIAAGAQLLESIYPLVPHAIIFTTVGAALAWRHRRELTRLAPKLALAATLVLAAAVLVLGPYLAFKATWGSLAGRESFLHPVGALAPGGGAYAGSLALALATVGLVDRLQRRGGERDLHAPLLVAGLLVVWMSVAAVPLPGLGVALPSLFTVLTTVVPGFTAVRRGGAIIFGWYLVVIVLAGYGIAALGRGRATVVRSGLGAVLVALALVEVFVPSAARATFGRTFGLPAYDVRPSAPVLALYERMGPGVVLDLPYELGQGRFYRMGDFVLASAFHRHRVAACYNSFRVAIQDDVMAYAARVLTDPRAAEALAALDIRNVVLHLGLPARTAMTPPAPLPPHLEEVGRAGDQIVYRITSTPALSEAADALELRLAPAPDAPAGGLVLVFRNRAATLYRHPDPIKPTAFVVRWYGDAPTPLAEERVRVLLPTVLPPGEELRRALAGAPTTPARRVTLAAATDPTRALATLDLQ